MSVGRSITSVFRSVPVFVGLHMLHSTTPTSTPNPDTDTSDTRNFLKLVLWQAEQGSRPTRRHPRDDPREDVGVGIGIGVVECGLMHAQATCPYFYRDLACITIKRKPFIAFSSDYSCFGSNNSGIKHQMSLRVWDYICKQPHNV